MLYIKHVESHLIIINKIFESLSEIDLTHLEESLPLSLHGNNDCFQTSYFSCLLHATANTVKIINLSVD